MPVLNRFSEAAIARNPAWVQLLGLCPLLAVSNTIANALGLAVASAAVLIGSATLVSLARRFIPADVRLPCFVLVIATFTTLVNLAMEAYAFDLYQRIALFVQIIVTNCMILARIEQVAAKESLGRTVLDACGAAVGFAAAILALGAAREVLAIGFPLAALPPGAFLVAGLLLALTNMRRGQATDTGASAPADEKPQARTVAGQR
ncbi:MAG: electron transport complex subunit RsxE [Gammaproteobacteria bacterium]|nr:electron transport complex subunit RsxE [Gammaproteobacteria bacterium]